MISDDSSTLTLGPFDALTSSGRTLPAIPALTIAWHPDPQRVGVVAPLTALLKSDRATLNRDEPLFFTPGSDQGHPVDHRGMSRDPVLVLDADGKGWQLSRGSSKSEVELEGVPFAGSRRLDAGDLSKGLILTVARQFVFCLHSIQLPITRSPILGLVGSGDAIEEVRRAILSVADLATTVLVRGETGTGKELVANAIHESSRRRGKPFVAVNMSVIRPERAAAELFGYERGSFTGATQSHPGYFRSAHGGSLFLDEIGLAPPEVQPMLLRVLEDQRVQSLGSGQARQVDVRLIAATDARLEEAVAAGRFEASLYHRLNSAFQIPLPALRQRREDIGLLFVTFLRDTLAANGGLHRLEEPPAKAPPWIAGRVVAEICSAPWSGNVRALKALARDLVIRSVGDGHSRAQRLVAEYLKTQLPIPAVPAKATDKSSLPSEVRGLRNGDISNEQILVALEKTGWRQVRAAKLLGLSPPTLSRRLAKEPAILILTRIELADLLRDVDALGGDIGALARRMGISAHLLERRLRNATRSH
jgi:two-component system, NtrC family, nitrogen regulation response regulator GlnG